MKRFYSLLMAGIVACSVQLADAQQPQAQVLSPARVRSADLPGGARTVNSILVVGGNRSTLLYKIRPEEIDPRQLPMTSVQALFFVTPDDYISANESYNNEKYREARAKFEAVKNKYKPVMEVPDNYALKAAIMEIECALRMLDWPAVKSLTAALPKQNYLLTGKVPNDIDVYNLLGKLADKNPQTVIDAAKAMLVSKDKWNLEQYSRIAYALGMAQAKKGDVNDALNNLAIAIVAQHGGGLDLTASAMLQSMELLAADSAVDAYLKNASLGDLLLQEKERAPQKLKELANMVYLYKNILFPNRKLDGKYDKYLRVLLTPEEKAAKKAAQEQPADAPAEEPAGQKKADEKKPEAKPAQKPADKKADAKKPEAKPAPKKK